MALLPKVKLKALVSFPATILDGTGVDVVKANGSYQFNLDFGDFAPPVTSISDPTHQNFLLWNNLTGQYALASTLLVSGSGPPGPQGPAGPPGATGAGSGNVNGPASAVADRIAVYSGTSGTVIKDGGQIVANLAPLASPAFTGTITVNGVLTVSNNGGYSAFNTGSGAAALIGGGVGDPVNYHRNGSHAFQNLAGSSTYATLDATGLTAPIVSTSNLNTSDTTAVHSFNHGLFGGNFNLGQSLNVLALDKTATDASVGPRFTMAITSEVAGGHANGPADQRSPLWLFSGKKNWLTSGNTGEIDGAYMLVQQGNLGDGGGLLIGANKVFAGGGTGGLVAVETSTARVNTSGTTTDMIESIVGLQEGAGGALNSGGAAFYAEAKTGTTGVGIAIVNDTSAFNYAIAAFTSRNPANGYFSVQYDGTTVVRLGSASSHISLRYASNAFFIRDETNATNLVGVTKTGVLSSSAGVTPATGSSTITRALRVKASVTFGTIAAQSSAIVDVSVPGCIVDDMVHVNMTANYASDSEIVTGRVLSNGTVRLSANNNSNTPLVTSAQDAIICVFGMT